MSERYCRNDHNTWYESLSHYEIKELRHAIKDSGLTSPYFNNVAKSIFNSYDLTPADCRNVASMILTNWQHILRDFEWRELLSRLIDNYVGGPCAQFTIAQLAGDAPNDKAEDQAAGFVLTDVKSAARKALRRVEPAGSHGNASFTIVRGETEACGSFSDQLTLAVERQCPDKQAHPHLIKILAFSNADEECKGVIAALPNQLSVPQKVLACCKL